MGRQMDNFEIEACTKAAHEVHRAYCEAMGDFSHTSWEMTAPDLRAVARQATIGIVTSEHNAEQSHEAWVAAKRAAGWNYGEKKSETLKTHPCLVEYSKLPYEIQVKNDLWIFTVKNMMTAFIRIPKQ